MTDPHVILNMNHITKTFPGVKALDEVSLTVRRGEIHAICGENGAGKSTLMNVLYGLYQADEGEILLDGHDIYGKDVDPVAVRNTIGMVFQRFNLFPQSGHARSRQTRRMLHRCPSYHP